MKRLLLILLVSLWPVTVFGQSIFTPRLHLEQPLAAPGTFGAALNSNFSILDSAAGGVADTTCPAGQKVSSIVAGVATCTPTTLLNESLYLVGVLSPPQIVANTNDYNPTNLATASTLYINTDASRNLTGITGGATGRVLFIYNSGSFNVVLINESNLSSAINRFAINANITLGPAQGIIFQYDSVATRWRAASGVSGAGGQAADNDLTAIAALTGNGFPAQINTDTWALRQITGQSGNIIITNPKGIAGDVLIDTGANVALTSRSFTPTTGDWNFSSAASLTAPIATGAAPTASGRIAYDSTANTFKGGINGVSRTFATTDLTQPLSTNLTALSGLTGANGAIPVFTGAGTMGLAQFILCVNSGGNVLHISSLTPVTFTCDSSSGVLSGMTPGKLQKSLTSTTIGDSIISEAASVATVNGGLVVGTGPFLVFDTSAVASTDKTWTVLNFSGTIRPSTGAITAGHVLTTDANGLIIDGGAGGSGTWTDSSTNTTTSNKTLIDALAGGGAGNVIKSQGFWSFDGGSLTADGTNCQDPVKVTINSGPTQYAILCATPNSAQFDAVVPDLKQAVATIKVRLKANDTVNTQTVAGTFKAQCRATGTAPSSTWGSTQTVSITLTTLNTTYEGLTATITPNGTCSANSDLYIRYNATGGSNSATTRFLGLGIEQQS